MATIDIKRGAATVLSPKIDENSRRSKSLNGADYIIVRFSHDQPVNFYPGDYVDFLTIRYTIREAFPYEKISNRHYEYELRFEGPYYDLEEAMFILDGDSEFFLTGKAEDFLDLIITNLSRKGGSFSKGAVEDTVFKNLQFNNETCLNVLQRICDEFDLEYSISSSQISLVERVGNATGVSLQYHQGLKKISRDKVSDKNIITRLFAYGSEKNLNHTYATKRLHLPAATYPNKYMEDGVSNYGVREAVKFFEDVYPHFTGTVTSTAENNKVIDTGINFDINDHLIEALTAKIVFLTGDLAGMEFEIFSFNNSTKEVTFNTYTDEAGLELPSDTFKPAVDDKFTFVDISMPSNYIAAAEAELAVEAVKYLAEMSSPNVQYSVETDGHYLRGAGTVLDVGDLVMITDDALAPGGLEFRILEFDQEIANPYNYQIEIGEHVLVSYLSRMTTEREELRREVKVVRNEAITAIRRKYAPIDELQDLIFDTDGYFDPDKIRPLSIETSMLTVGNKTSQMALIGCLIEPNYMGNENYIRMQTGQFIHFSIESSPRTWNINTIGFSLSLAPTSPYYIYVRADVSTSSAYWQISNTKWTVGPHSGKYYFLVAVLSSVIDGERVISGLYGQTTINGGFIRTGRVESLDGNTYMDLDTGEIVIGRGSFRSSSDNQRVEIEGQEYKMYDGGDLRAWMRQNAGKGGAELRLYDTYGNYVSIDPDGVGLNETPGTDPVIKFAIGAVQIGDNMDLDVNHNLTVLGNAHVEGNLTVTGTYPSDHAIEDAQPLLSVYWHRAQRIKKLPPFEKRNRRSIGEYLSGLEEAVERNLRYIVELEQRIEQLEQR